MLLALAGRLRATYALIAVNLVAFAGEQGQLTRSGESAHGSLIEEGALDRPDVIHAHQYWRLVSSGFLHANLTHIGLNMFTLFMLGLIVEPVAGVVRFSLIYFTALLGGSLGALLSSSAWVLGASGAIFGLMGALAVYSHARGVNIFRSGLVPVIAFGILSSFSAHVSVGGHVGGLAAGTLAALAIVAADRRGRTVVGFAGTLALCAILVVASVTFPDASGSRPRFAHSTRERIARFVRCMEQNGVTVYEAHLSGRNLAFKIKQAKTSHTNVDPAMSRCSGLLQSP